MNVPSLTGVRGIAALWVLVFHVQAFPKSFDIVPLGGLPILRSGWAGVDLFFVLSGFILMLVHEADFKTLSWLRIGRFAWLRFFRVYPLATVVLLLIGLLALADAGFAYWYQNSAHPRNFTLVAFIRTLLLANRWWLPTDGDWNQPEWSLSAEIVGYMAFPLIAYAAAKITNRWLLVGLAFACLIYPTADAYFHGTHVADDIFWGALPRMAGAFTGGIVLCRLHRLTPESWRHIQGRVADVGLLALIVALCTPVGGNVTTICSGAIIYGIASDRGIANSLFAAPVSVFLGRISFPLYLIHVMPLTWLRYNIATYPVPEWFAHVALALTLVFIFASAWVLHVTVERPAHRFARDAMRPRGEATVLAAGAANG
jgi:peptidoglycan/LPS O-acetylase OafA/YrhL